MTDWQGIAEVISATGIAVPAIGSFWLAYKNQKAVQHVSDQVGIVHELTNSNSEKLTAVTAAASFAEGKEAGIDQERANPQVPSNINP